MRHIINSLGDDDDRSSYGAKVSPQKIWKIVTWRWRLQLAINAPFGVLWVADKTNPAVHAFDMSMLAAIHAEWMAPMMGIG